MLPEKARVVSHVVCRGFHDAGYRGKAIFATSATHGRLVLCHPTSQNIKPTSDFRIRIFVDVALVAECGFPLLSMRGFLPSAFVLSVHMD